MKMKWQSEAWTGFPFQKKKKNQQLSFCGFVNWAALILLYCWFCSLMHVAPFHRGRSTFNSLNYVLNLLLYKRSLIKVSTSSACPSFSSFGRTFGMPELHRDRGSLSAPDRSSPTRRHPRARWDSWPWCQVHGFAKDAASIPYLDC